MPQGLAMPSTHTNPCVRPSRFDRQPSRTSYLANYRRNEHPDQAYRATLLKCPRFAHVDTPAGSKQPMCLRSTCPVCIRTVALRAGRAIALAAPDTDTACPWWATRGRRSAPGWRRWYGACAAAPAPSSTCGTSSPTRAAPATTSTAGPGASARALICSARRPPRLAWGDRCGLVRGRPPPPRTRPSPTG